MQSESKFSVASLARRHRNSMICVLNQDIVPNCLLRSLIFIINLVHSKISIDHHHRCRSIEFTLNQPTLVKIMQITQILNRHTALFIACTNLDASMRNLRRRAKIHNQITLNLVMLVNELVPLLQYMIHRLVNHVASQHLLNETIACTEDRPLHHLHRLWRLFDVMLEHCQCYIVLEWHSESIGILVQQVEKVVIPTKEYESFE